MHRALIIGLTASVGIATPAAFAQTVEQIAQEQPQQAVELFACSEITEATARLACYDREVAELKSAQEAKEVVIASREQVTEARRGLFGLTLPKIKLFGGGDDGEEPISEISATIQSARQVGRGKWIFVLEDGAKWQQSDSVPVLGTPKAGDTIIIKRAAMGSYKAKIGKRRAIRVRRLN